MENKILYKCPFTNQVIDENNQIGSYLRWTAKKRLISSELLLYMVYEATFGDIIKKDQFRLFYEEKDYSLPRFKSEFQLGYQITQFLIKYHECKKRTHAQSCKVGAIKSKQTNLERYGVDQTFKVPEFDKKRKETYLERYGVDNPFKVKNFMDSVEDTYQKKYGCSLRERKSVKSKEAWENKTAEEKESWLNNSLLSEKGRLNNKGGNHISGLEVRIGRILLELGIKFQTQFRINRRFFDFLLTDLNILIEINGTIYHADPEIYKENDILPVTSRIAKEIWEKDKEKIDLAINKGYYVIIIWEREMKNKNDKEIFKMIYEKIKDCKNYQTE